MASVPPNGTEGIEDPSEKSTLSDRAISTSQTQQTPKIRTFCQACLCPIDKQKKCCWRDNRSLEVDIIPHIGMFIGINANRLRDNDGGSTTCLRCLKTGSFYGDINVDCLNRICLVFTHGSKVKS